MNPQILNVASFICLFIFGYFISKILNSTYETIPVIVNPTPWNTDDKIYMDKAGVCYKYETLRRPCPSYDRIHKIAIQ